MENRVFPHFSEIPRKCFIESRVGSRKTCQPRGFQAFAQNRVRAIVVQRWLNCIALFQLCHQVRQLRHSAELLRY